MARKNILDFFFFMYDNVYSCWMRIEDYNYRRTNNQSFD